MAEGPQPARPGPVGLHLCPVSADGRGAPGVSNVAGGTVTPPGPSMGRPGTRATHLESPHLSRARAAIAQSGIRGSLRVWGMCVRRDPTLSENWEGAAALAP